MALIIGPLGGCGQWIIPHDSPSGGYANPDLLIDPSQAALTLASASTPIILDARDDAAFESGHLPGAIHVALNVLNDDAGLLLPPEIIAESLGDLGIHHERDVLIYGAAETGWGTDGRLFWLLEYLGHEGKIQLMNGGFPAWEAQGYDHSTAAAPLPQATYIPDTQGHLLATTEDVQRVVDEGGIQLIDTRTVGEYRAGHIPGALFYEWDDSLNVDGTVRHADDLLAALTRLGIDPSAPTIGYCELGYRSAHFYVTARLLGFDSIANYDGSWAVWSAAGGAVEVE